MKNSHKVWSKRDILQLIDKYRQNEVLWNTRLPEYKNRTLKQEGLKELALFFETPISEIQRKLHNLRCQLNSEVKKLRRRSDCASVGDLKSSWEYFDHLVFLLSASSIEDQMEGIDLSEHLETMIEGESSSYFNSEEYEQYQISDSKNAPLGIKAEPELNADGLQDDYGKELLAGCSRLKEISFDVRTKVKRELRADENEEMYNGPSIKKTKLQEIRDDSQIFGDFVAAELRNLKSETNRKKLKRIILRGVLEVSESED
ncbi:uncharacterized protein [Halyomorpha halys]|uniref:uncharacterized protein isoform X1 n=1 Tax=Halyomorpha halys TaxID=286706 RepID=UPI0006D50BB0|nr:uncharacterized protein LOC106687713 isoform X1 [Halyomorpha halys]